MSDQLKICFTIVVVLLFMLLLAVFIITLIYRSQLRQIAFLRSMDEIKMKHEKVLLQTQVEMQEQTFQEISREIHDHVALSLSLCKLNLNTIDFRKHADMVEKINLSKALLGKTISSLGNISRTLDTEHVSRIGFTAAVEDEIAYLRRTQLFEVDYKSSGEPMSLGCKSEMILFRIFQEALNNIIRHAAATRITISIAFAGNKMMCSVTDNGKGFSAASDPGRAGLGLINMKKRASLLDANLSITSSPNEGTNVCIEVPLVKP